MAPTPRRWLRPIWWLVYAAVVYGVVVYVSRNWETIRQVEYEGRWYHLAASLALMLASAGMAVAAFRYFLEQFGLRLSMWTAFRVFSLPQVGKYLPGRVGALPASMWLLQREGLPASHGLSVTAVFTAFATQSGLFVGLLLLPSALKHFNPAFRGLIGLAAIAGLIFCCTPLVWRVLDRLLKLLGRPTLDRHPTAGAMVRLLLWLMARWLVIGAAYVLLARFIAPITPAQVPLLMAAFPLAYYVGVLAVLAPAGIGVQEGMLIVILDSTFGPGFAAIFAGLSRVTLVAVDVIVVIAALCMKRLPPASGSAETGAEPGQPPSGD